MIEPTAELDVSSRAIDRRPRWYEAEMGRAGDAGRVAGDVEWRPATVKRATVAAAASSYGNLMIDGAPVMSSRKRSDTDAINMTSRQTSPES